MLDLYWLHNVQVLFKVHWTCSLYKSITIQFFMQISRVSIIIALRGLAWRLGFPLPLKLLDHSYSLHVLHVVLVLLPCRQSHMANYYVHVGSFLLLPIRTHHFPSTWINIPIPGKFGDCQIKIRQTEKMVNPLNIIPTKFTGYTVAIIL